MNIPVQQDTRLKNSSRLRSLERADQEWAELYNKADCYRLSHVPKYYVYRH